MGVINQQPTNITGARTTLHGMDLYHCPLIFNVSMNSWITLPTSKKNNRFGGFGLDDYPIYDMAIFRLHVKLREYNFRKFPN